jgi:hypothetical protein
MMLTCRRPARAKLSVRSFGAVIALGLVGSLSSAEADDFGGPRFRKGLWHFVRTLDLVVDRKVKHRLLEREMTACVDPTQSMIATFSSPPIASCVSAKPERVGNRYTFANRCDYMGPVRTTITVNSDASYTELNELHSATVPRAELVVAERLGDCEPGGGKSEDVSATSLH